MKLKAVAILIFSFAIFSLPAAEPALYIDDTSTTAKRHFSLEFSADYYKDIEKELDPDTEEYEKTVSKEITLTSSISYGLTDNWEIELTTPYRFLDDTSIGKVNGFSDIVIDTKYRLWDEKKFLPSYALYFDLKTSSGNEYKSLGTGEKNFGINNIFTKCIEKNIFDLNLGYTFVGGDSRNIFYYAFDWTRNLSKNTCLCNEIYGETTFEGDFDDNILVYTLSLDHQINEIVCLEVGTGIGISQASADLQISSTITFNF